MPNWQEVNHVKKHVLGEIVYIDFRIFQDIGNDDLPNAFQLSADVRLLGAVIGQSGQVALKNGPIAVIFLRVLAVGNLQGQLDDWRGVLADGSTLSAKAKWDDAMLVVFKISAIGNVAIPIKILPIRVKVDLAHTDIATLIHRDAASKPIGIESLA